MLVKSKKRVLISFYMTNSTLNSNSNYVKGNKKVLSEHYYFKEIQQSKRGVETIDNISKVKGNKVLRTSKIYY